VEAHGSYIREKLRGAKATITSNDRPLQERLWSAYGDNLSNLEAKWFPHADAQEDFATIERELSKHRGAIEGMSDDETAALAERILALADRYLA